jgi:hypothetical protein
MGSSYLPPPEQNVVNVGDELSQTALDAINAASFPSSSNPFRTLNDGGVIGEYDNFKVYQAGELVIESDKLYKFNAFIGAAGYGPTTHPGAWTMISGADLSAYAPIASPIFTGDARAVTPALSDNDTSIATTAFVKGQDYAQLSGATFTGSVIVENIGSPVAVLRMPTEGPPLVNHGDIWIDGGGKPWLGVVEDFEGEPNRLSYRIALLNEVGSYAPLFSPVFTGNPTAPTPFTGDNDTSIATTAFVKAQGYLTSSALTPYATNASPALTGTATITNPPGSSGGLSVVTSGVNAYTSSLTSNILRVGFLNYQNANAYMTATEVGVGGDATGYARLSTNNTGGYNPQFTLFESGPAALVQGRSTIIKEGGFFVDNNDGIGPVEVYAPYAVLDTKASLSGAAFTGKISGASIDGNAGVNIGIGGVSTTATTPGDMWIATGGVSLNYRDGNGAWRIVAVANSLNTFSSPQVINTTSATTALRVTQAGAGAALLVEDSTTPDTSALVVDASGNVGIGVAAGYTSTSKVEVVGNVKADTFSNGAGPAFSVNSTTSHTGGSHTLDLLVTIGGVNYRIGLRPA